LIEGWTNVGLGPVTHDIDESETVEIGQSMPSRVTLTSSVDEPNPVPVIVRVTPPAVVPIVGDKEVS
jgi:hypothetical protein